VLAASATSFLYSFAPTDVGFFSLVGSHKCTYLVLGQSVLKLNCFKGDGIAPGHENDLFYVDISEIVLDIDTR